MAGLVADTAWMLVEGTAFLAQRGRGVAPRRPMHACFRPFAKVLPAGPTVAAAAEDSAPGGHRDVVVGVAEDSDDDDEWINCESPEPAATPDDDVTFTGTTHASDTPAGTWEAVSDGILVRVPK